MTQPASSWRSQQGREEQSLFTLYTEQLESWQPERDRTRGSRHDLHQRHLQLITHERAQVLEHGERRTSQRGSARVIHPLRRDRRRGYDLDKGLGREPGSAIRKGIDQSIDEVCVPCSSCEQGEPQAGIGFGELTQPRLESASIDVTKERDENRKRASITPSGEWLFRFQVQGTYEQLEKPARVPRCERSEVANVPRLDRQSTFQQSPGKRLIPLRIGGKSIDENLPRFIDITVFHQTMDFVVPPQFGEEGADSVHCAVRADLADDLAQHTVADDLGNIADLTGCFDSDSKVRVQLVEPFDSRCLAPEKPTGAPIVEKPEEILVPPRSQEVMREVPPSVGGPAPIAPVDDLLVIGESFALWLPIVGIGDASDIISQRVVKE